ncbi:MAG: hypothetical protein Q7J31_11170, partial [Syntrophales bacterium]|nr:hypothetical protein [Syntrophales bacterium]
GAGAGAGAGSGAGVSTVAAGVCSSAFLHPTTANDNVTKKSRERIIENVFFIDGLPPFKDFKAPGDNHPLHPIGVNDTPFFYLVK